MIGARRSRPPTLLCPGFGSACAYLAALVVLAVIVLAMRAEMVAQFAPVVSR